ncbi:chemotaxis protein CheA [Curvibacter sp. HBC61]|uniref:Chemotaxis protein CheA n=1 Tax=Curvibacter cyanobacteriorum TaxID=3026422 RepID=A0ABT5MVQ3_9BURK|nr:chemotaxis protein CheA [Curvibacter sp. HBC61]MDD0837399.1 chemotaxis protein CheA [Curvibacter sp. HBC61]
MSASDSDADYDFIAAAMPAFISEAREQVSQIEQLLLQLEEDPRNREQLDALFRCAHTVKGSAGIFGLTQVVDFTHHIETLLDELREGRLFLDAVLSSLLLACNDQILALVNQAAGEAQDDGAQQDRRDALVRQLRQAMGQAGAPVPPAAAPDEAAPAAEARLGRWHLSAHFGADCFRNGMDPLSVVRYLAGRTEVTALASDRSRLPPLEQLDPESCHLSVEISMRSEGPQEAVDDAFSFIRDDCQLHLIPPSAPTSRYVELLEELPDHPRLGELLVNVGAITEEQLAAGLDQQEKARAHSPTGPAPRLGEILQEQTGLAQDVLAAAVQKQQRPREAAADEQRYIRIPADRLDAVINLLGELVTAAAGADMLARQTRQSRLIEANQHIGHLIEEIRNGTLQLRMVPIGATFNRFRRVVRDTASELGKEVSLEIEGGDTELDKAVVEKIADPLMHLVRNGLDHGLETPAERLAHRKPAQGRLVLSAQHESGSILIRISDDGRGVDRQRVLQRAWERGLVEPGVVPPDEDILQLIFEPGFSTATQVTNLSGRGVGMDVVRQNIEALRGSVTVYSEAGRGTDIDIRLPLTLAIIDGFLISVGPSKFVLPLESVVEVVEGQAAAGAEAAQPDASGRYCMPLRGQLLPVISLRQLYHLDSPRPERVSIVIVQAGPTRFGLEVDQLLGQNQTVIKPLGRLFHTLRGISGSSILGSGEVALIFDVLALGALAVQAPRRASPQPQQSSVH